jgi:hypothetical protein
MLNAFLDYQSNLVAFYQMSVIYSGLTRLSSRQNVVIPAIQQSLSMTLILQIPRIVVVFPTSYLLTGINI